MSNISTITTFVPEGLSARRTSVETQVSSGIGVHIVGVTDNFVKECLLRTITAMQCFRYYIPGKKVVVNITPPSLVQNVSSILDLPVALSLIDAAGHAAMPLKDRLAVCGELALDGRLRDVPGMLLAADAAARAGLSGIILPGRSAQEAVDSGLLPDGFVVFAANTLYDAVRILSGEPSENFLATPKDTLSGAEEELPSVALDEGSVRAVTIAAAGGLNLVLTGGQSDTDRDAARLLAAVLPDDESAMRKKIYSASGKPAPHGVPLRNPHCSASLAAMVGGGPSVSPGEVSLAHGGVLLLENAGMFHHSVMRALRGIQADRSVTIRRLHSVIEYPSDFTIVATGGADVDTATPSEARARLYGCVGEIHAVHHSARKGDPLTREQIIAVREAVARARSRAAARLTKHAPAKTNARLPSVVLMKFCGLAGGPLADLLDRLIQNLNLSARSYGDMLRIALTIADLDGKDTVDAACLAEAAGYLFLHRLDDKTSEA